MCACAPRRPDWSTHSSSRAVLRKHKTHHTRTHAHTVHTNTNTQRQTRAATRGDPNVFRIELRTAVCAHIQTPTHHRNMHIRHTHTYSRTHMITHHERCAF